MDVTERTWASQQLHINQYGMTESAVWIRLLLHPYSSSQRLGGYGEQMHSFSSSCSD